MKAPQTPSIKTVFTLKSEDVHTQSNGTQVQCFWWTCVQKGCKLDGHPIKEICKGTRQLFLHLKNCNNNLWLQLQLSSKHSNCLGPQLLSDYAFLHYNYKYDWLRLTLKEIVDTYTKLYGKESRELDIESDRSSAAEEVEEDGEEE